MDRRRPCPLGVLHGSRGAPPDDIRVRGPSSRRELSVSLRHDLIAEHASDQGSGKRSALVATTPRVLDRIHLIPIHDHPLPSLMRTGQSTFFTGEFCGSLYRYSTWTIQLRISLPQPLTGWRESSVQRRGSDPVLQPAPRWLIGSVWKTLKSAWMIIARNLVTSGLVLLAIWNVFGHLKTPPPHGRSVRSSRIF